MSSLESAQDVQKQQNATQEVYNPPRQRLRDTSGRFNQWMLDSATHPTKRASGEVPHCSKQV